MCVCVYANSIGFLCAWYNSRGCGVQRPMSRSQRSKVNFFNTDRQKTNVILASCRNFLPRKRCVKFIRCPLTSPLIACKITAITNYVRLALVFCSKCLQRSRDAIKANQRILITAFYPAHISCKGKNNDTKRQLYGSFFSSFLFLFQHSSPKDALVSNASQWLITGNVMDGGRDVTMARRKRRGSWK